MRASEGYFRGTEARVDFEIAAQIRSHSLGQIWSAAFDNQVQIANETTQKQVSHGSSDEIDRRLAAFRGRDGGVEKNQLFGCRLSPQQRCDRPGLIHGVLTI